MNLGVLARQSNAETRSISPENLTGAPGSGAMAETGTNAFAARRLGQGWKVSPSVEVAAGETFVVADIEGEGAIQQIWMTPVIASTDIRHLILRFTWDEHEHPSIEVPLGDFFACGWDKFTQVSSLPVCVNPARGFNCYWEMPFRTHAKITIENRSDTNLVFFYQINYVLTDVPSDCLYFHAQFRRSNPVPLGKEHVILDDISGAGHFVGTYIAWGVNNNGWWGEGEVKFFIDDDKQHPSNCGTGTEDYFGGSHNFDLHAADRSEPKEYVTFTGPYCGFSQVIKPDGMYVSSMRFGMYRWHVTDPIRFKKRLKATVQSLGWFNGGINFRDKRLMQRQDDVSSTAFWYQTLPSKPLVKLQSRDELEVI